MTRKEIEEQYEITKDGFISTFGKFEMEPVYVPYFWDFYLNGFEDDTDSFNSISISGYVVTEKDREEFPELEGIYGVALYEDYQGAVDSESFETKEEYEDFFCFEEEEEVV